MENMEQGNNNSNNQNNKEIKQLQTAKNNIKKFAIHNHVSHIPQTQKEMVNSFMLEQEKIQREWKKIEIAHKILDAEEDKLMGEIAKKRKELLQREKNNLDREENNVRYGRSINRVYAGSIIFDNGVNENDDDEGCLPYED